MENAIDAADIKWNDSSDVTFGTFETLLMNEQENLMETKPGWKTTEFWLALFIPPAIGAVNQIFGLGIDPGTIMGLFGFTIPGYAVSRGLAK